MIGSNPIGVTKKRKSWFDLEQNNCCSICKNPDTWNNKILILILDHIDENAYNNIRDNLRLVCYNFDYQLDTYKSKNKKSARTDKYKQSKNN